MNKPALLRFLVYAGFLAAFSPTITTAKNLGWHADTLAQELSSIKHLPPAPRGVAHLKFSEFFVQPIGNRGLEYTATIKKLAGQRVRVLGFMVRQTRPAPGTVILTPYAMATHEGEYGLCDDLPPSTMFVHVPKYADLAVPFTPGPLLLTGTLELGPRQESDGRVSHVRLVLDPETAVTAAPTEPATTSTASNNLPAHRS